jgi:predicted phosphodiesterase
MRRLLQRILLKPILWATEKFSSKPQKEKIFPALTNLREEIIKNPGKKGIQIQLSESDQFIIFSDQHRGAKNGADDFMNAEPAYLAALDYYYRKNFQFISLGDSEELWENLLGKVKKNNAATFQAEKLFIQQNRFYKVFGNHDLYWVNDPLAWWQLKNIYGQEVKVYEGLILEATISNRQYAIGNRQLAIDKFSYGSDSNLPIANCQLTIFLTHGHQGDASSDGNWFSKFFVSRIWGPLQAYLRINPNTPAYDEQKKTEHNRIMYEWSAGQKNLILVTGHTHQPVFGSLTHLERLYKKLLMARQNGNADQIREAEAEVRKMERQFKSVAVDYLQMKPTYFNSGCCCYRDGDITGIEIGNGKISLVKWNKTGERILLEETTLSELYGQIQ